MAFYLIRWIRREILLAKPKEKILSAVVLFNIFFLFILYSTDHTLRHQATFTLRRILGYHEENLIYEKVVQGKETNSLDWIEKSPNLKQYLKTINEDDFTDEEKKETMRIALFESLVQLAKSEYEKGHEFPHLLKLEPVRSAIKILKKIDADLHKLQEEMEGAYELCKGCLQEKYGKKSKKLPQVICIGAKKCGTGAFQNFLAHHPHLHKPPGLDEVHFFDNDAEYSKGIEYYHNLMPETAGGEVTYEKTPKYMVIPEVPERIYAMNSTIKLIAIVCNPVNRAFSDYTHVVKSHYFHNVIKRYQSGDDDDEKSRLEGFERFTKDYIKIFEEKSEELGEEQYDRWIQNVHENKVEASILANGLYWIHMKNWLEAGFTRDQMLILNGEELIANPSKVILKAQDFMGLEPMIKEENFVFDHDKGFYCFQKEKSGSGPSCLGDGKGRTRKEGGPNFSPELKEQMYKFFKKSNEGLFKWIGEDFGWN